MFNEVSISSYLRNSRDKNICFEILSYCASAKNEHHSSGCTEEEIWDYISKHPVFIGTFQEPFSYTDELIHLGYLAVSDADAPENEELSENLDEQNSQNPNIDTTEPNSDLQATLLHITDAGRTLLSQLSPEDRLGELLARNPDRFDSFVKVLDFCTATRSLQDICTFVKNTPDISRETPIDAQLLSPDFYVSELERAGGVIWDGGWITTPYGNQFLDHLKKEA